MKRMLIKNQYRYTIHLDFLQSCTSKEWQKSQSLAATLLCSLREQELRLQTRWSENLAPLEHPSLRLSKDWKNAGVDELREPEASVSGRDDGGASQEGSIYKVPGVPTANEGLKR